MILIMPSLGHFRITFCGVERVEMPLCFLVVSLSSSSSSCTVDTDPIHLIVMRVVMEMDCIEFEIIVDFSNLSEVQVWD